MKKTIRPCRVSFDKNNTDQVSCTIEIEDGNLSISGTIYGKYGSSGQIDMEFDHKDKSENDSRYSNPIKAEDLFFELGWNKDLWYEFLHNEIDSTRACIWEDKIMFHTDNENEVDTFLLETRVKQLKFMLENAETYLIRYQNGKQAYTYKHCEKEV